MEAERRPDEQYDHDELDAAIRAWTASAGPSVAGIAVTAVLAACCVLGAGFCALVAFVGAGVGIGDPDAYNGWAWTALVAGLVGAASPVALAVVTSRSRPGSASAVATFVVAGVLVVFGVLAALVGVGVLAG
ncbi:hypothetical protein [Curtobacterium sp. L1-20]|uniref:hypothetical protein n=1 Tax=Curtobacterium sp. L1-20 TaxID=3138181 RepID=UPI003B51B08E